MSRLGRTPPPQASGAMRRLDLLEKRVEAMTAGMKAFDDFRQDILRAMRHTFTIVEQRISSIEDILEAVVMIMGRADVEKKVRELAVEKLELKAAADKVALESAIKEGRVRASDKVGEVSIVVGSEVDKDGEPLHPLRVQQLWQAIQNPEMKEKLQGAVVGQVIETSIGTKFTVNEIYDITMQAQAEAADGKPVEVPVTETEQVPESEPLDEATEAQLLADLEDIEDVGNPVKTDENPTS